MPEDLVPAEKPKPPALSPERPPDAPAEERLDPRGEMPFFDHLQQLRKHFMRAMLWLGIGGIGAFFWIDRVWQLLLKPLGPVCAADPTTIKCAVYPRDMLESFWVYFELGLLLAAVLASPLILMEIWAFVSPGLYQREKRFVIPFSVAVTVLFVAGASFGFFVVFPPSFQFLYSFGNTGHFHYFISMDSYFSLCEKLLLSFGLIFELPPVMALLSMSGLVKPRWWKRYRRHMWFACFVFSAILTPSTDPLTMILMAVPMCILYEIGVIAARFLYRERTGGPDDDDPSALAPA